MLNELLLKIKSKESIQIKLNDVLLQKQDLESKLLQQKKVLNKENRDVEKLEYGSLTSFFTELLGNKEAKLTKEKEEAYQAKMKYDSLQYQLNDVIKSIEYYEKQLQELHDCQKQYEQLYITKLEELKCNDSRLVVLDDAIMASKYRQLEIHEAFIAGEQALHISNKVLSKLDSAKGWAQYDLIGGGGITDLIKYSNLDDAQRLVNELQAQLSSFKTELLDVKIESNLQIEIESFLRFADFWFDGIFSSFAVYDRVKNAIVKINENHNAISNVVAMLKDLYENEQKNQTRLQQEIDSIVLKS